MLPVPDLMVAALPYVLLLVGFVFLIKGADWLVRGSSSIARSFQVSEFIIGLTVVSFGTSLPELVITLFAGAAGEPELAIATVIGSNLANILLVLGVASMIYPMSAASETVWREIPFTLLASLVLAAMLNDAFLGSGTTSGLGRGDGIVLLGSFCAFIYYISQSLRNNPDEEWVGSQAKDSNRRAVIEIIAGGAGLVIGGKCTIGGATTIAENLGMSDALIGLTVVAIGTSLPELATSAVAAYRRNVDIAVGNVVGSNIFNIFIVLGISSVTFPMTYDTSLNVDLGLMIVATILLFAFMFIGHPKRTIQRHEGAFFVLLYIFIIAFAVYRDSGVASTT